MTRRDASFSRTYLKRDNYRGPTLLRTIGGKARLSPLPDAGALADSSDTESVMAKTRADEDELAIYAQPMSSDDDDFISHSATGARANRNGGTTSQPLSSKRTRSTRPAPSTRSKRPRLSDVSTLDPAPGPTVDDALFPDPMSSWSSSVGSQKKKAFKKYRGRKTFDVPAAVENKRHSSESTAKFKVYEDVSPNNAAPATGPGTLQIAPLPERAPADVKGHVTLAVPHLPAGAVVSKDGAFRLPNLPDFPDLPFSATTVGTDSAASEDSGHGGPTRSRSDSSSSLSSADSMFILEHQGMMIQQGISLDDKPSTGQRCPVCQRCVRDSVALAVPDHLNGLPFHQQRRFCAQHQLVDARDRWDDQGYPTIDWEDLEQRRIPARLGLLKRIIHGDAQSFYLDELRARIEAAKGNRRALRTYLNEGILDVARQGYYGPKGARIMVAAITHALTPALNRALQSDATLRTTGVGGFVSAVLVPELTSQLVKDDLMLPSDAAARDVLAESTEIGLLLNPDDEYIERLDDDDK